MTTSYTASMFEKIKESLNKKAESGGGMREVLKFAPENTYLVRLLPNVHDPKNTIFGYTTFGWTSRATGQYISVVSPMTFGERCPVNEMRYKLYQGSDHEKSLAKLVKRNNQWLVNCYVIDNPTAPDTKGKVKIIRFGKQLHKIITDAISGDDAEDFGPSVFDLSENGNNLRIKVEKNEGGYATYISSKFTKATSVSGLTETVDAIYNKSFDLSKTIMVKSFDEIKEILNVHLLNSKPEVAPQTNKKNESANTESFEESSEGGSITSHTSDEPPAPGNDISDQDIEDLLKDL